MNKNLLIAVFALLLIFSWIDQCRQPSVDTGMPKDVQKEVAEEIGVKPEQVKEVIKYQTVTRTQIKTVVDTVGKIEYVDRWNEVKGELGPDTLRLDIVTKDSITVAEVQKKSGFLGLGEPKTYVSIKHANPNVQVNSIEHYEVKTKPKKYSVGIGVTYGWNGQSWQPSVGVTVSRTIFKF